MIENVKRMFRFELNGLRSIAKLHPDRSTWVAKDSVVDGTLSRALGVVLFVQLCDKVTYEEISPLYEEFKKEVEKIANGG